MSNVATDTLQAIENVFQALCDIRPVVMVYMDNVSVFPSADMIAQVAEWREDVYRKWYEVEKHGHDVG